jgi:hypothetical protein
VVVNLVEVSGRVCGNQALGPLMRCSVGRVNDRLVEVDDSDDILAADLLLGGQFQTSSPSRSAPVPFPQVQGRF